MNVSIREAVAARGFVLLRELAPELKTIEMMGQLGMIVEAASLQSKP
jgi:hypothetical protein